MHLMRLGCDVIINNLLPLLSQEDLFALTAVDSQLLNQIGHLRFQKTKVAKIKGFIIDYLQPATLDTIAHLTLNGNNTENNIIFGSTNFKGVISATLVTPITKGQIANFSHFVRRLSHLTELSDADDEEVTSLSALPAGCLNRLHTLSLELSLPGNLSNLLNVSLYLTKLTYLPDVDFEDVECYQDHAHSVKSLLKLCSGSTIMPGHRLLHVHLGNSSNPMLRTTREQILDSIWLAAGAHGGWKLFANMPDNSIGVPYPAAYEVYWSQKYWEFCMRPSEFEGFKKCCNSLVVYPHLDQFVSGKINVNIVEAPPLGALTGTYIDGLNIETDGEANLCGFFQVMNKHTTAITIKLTKCWGSVGSTKYSTDQFHRVTAMRIQGPSTIESGVTRGYDENIVATLTSSLCLNNWNNLDNLSLPIQAFQAPSLNDAGSVVPSFAACGTDVGGYSLKWLSSCNSLRAMQFTDWAVCYECNLANDISF